MATATATATLLQSHHCVSPKFPYLRIPNLTPRFSSLFPRKVRVLTFRGSSEAETECTTPFVASVKTIPKSKQFRLTRTRMSGLHLILILPSFLLVSHSKAEAYTSPPAKTEEWVQSTKDTTNATKDRTASAAQSAKDRTASAAQSAKDRTASAAQSAQEFAQHGKDQSAGFLQQTGEQVKNIAQNAVDSVKNTIGMAENNAKK